MKNFLAPPSRLFKENKGLQNGDIIIENKGLQNEGMPDDVGSCKGALLQSARCLLWHQMCGRQKERKKDPRVSRPFLSFSIATSLSISLPFLSPHRVQQSLIKP